GRGWARRRWCPAPGPWPPIRAEAEAPPDLVPPWPAGPALSARWRALPTARPSEDPDRSDRGRERRARGARDRRGRRTDLRAPPLPWRPRARRAPRRRRLRRWSIPPLGGSRRTRAAPRRRLRSARIPR